MLHVSSQQQASSLKSLSQGQWASMTPGILTHFFYLYMNNICKPDLGVTEIHKSSDLNQRQNWNISTFPSRDQMCSHRWGQMGASSRVCTSMNWNTSSLCMPSIASSRYLSFAAWNNNTAISTQLPGSNTQSQTHTPVGSNTPAECKQLVIIHYWALGTVFSWSTHVWICQLAIGFLHLCGT